MKSVLSALLSALLVLSLAACGSPAAPSSSGSASSPSSSGSASSQSPEEQHRQEQEALEEARQQRIWDLISSMTLEEKVGQLFFVRCPADSAVEDVSAYHLGGYILFGRDTKDRTANELIQTIQRYQDAAAIPLLIGVDEEGGTVVRVSSNPHLRSEKFASP